MSEFTSGGTTLTTDIEWDEDRKLVFVHMNFEHFTKASLRETKEAFSQLKAHYLQEQDLVVFGVTDNPRVLRIWELVEPCYQVKKIKSNEWLGSWLLED